MDESRHSLVTLSSSDLSRERLPGNYSRLKLGCEGDVDFFARRLAESLLLLDELKHGKWLVTGPPLTVLPSAANLLAHRVVYHLHMRHRSNVSLMNLRKRSDLDLFPHGHFANLDAADREAVLARSARSKWLGDENFAGQSVIVVDDVHVTGANERALSLFLESLGAQQVFWAYLIDLQLDPDSDPSLEEPRLNSLFFDRNESFAQVLEKYEIQPTTRLIWGLFAMSAKEFAGVSDAISPALASKIVLILVGEGFKPNSQTSARWSFFEQLAQLKT